MPFVYNISFVLPDVDYFRLERTFNLSCEYHETTFSNSRIISPHTILDSVGQPTTGKPPAAGDNSFLTYVIVVVNLFLIAVVVFAGLWWRN